MSSIESEMNVVQTQAFIDHDPLYVTLSRPEVTGDGAGGAIVEAPALLNAQRVRVSGQTRPRVVTTPEGKQVEVDLSLIGLPDFDVQVGDLFILRSWQYEVVNVQDQPAWRMVAEAVRRKITDTPNTSAFSFGFDEGFQS
jgi:hypothetical protein